MKVVLISREYPPDTSWGGIAFTYEKIASTLAAHGHQVHVICQAVTKPEDVVLDGIAVHRVGKRAQRYSGPARLDYSFYAWIKLREIIRKKGADVVCASYWGAEGFLCSLFEKVPLIITTHTSAQEILKTITYTGKRQYLDLKMLSFLENFALRRATRIIANSGSIFSHLIATIPPAEVKTDVVHYAVETGRFKIAAPDNALRQELGIAPNYKIVLCIGRLEWRKGSHILLKAIQQVVEHKPHTIFLLLGKDSKTAPSGGSFKQYILDNAKQGNFTSNLVFIESVPPATLVQMYQTCDVYVSASLQESFGMTVIEAMACGRPVVATPTGIVPELEAYHLAGVSIVPVGNAEKLAGAIIEFLSLSEDEKRKIAEQNRDLVEKEFSLKLWSDKIVKIFERVLSKGRQNSN